MQSAFVESLSSRFHDESPNEHLFHSLPDTRLLIAEWRADYTIPTTARSLGGLTPKRVCNPGPQGPSVQEACATLMVWAPNDERVCWCGGVLLRR